MKIICRYLSVILVLLTSFSAIAQETVVDSFYLDGYWRTYRVHLPPDVSLEEPTPLVFNLHGSGSNAIQQEFYSQMNLTSDSSGFIVVYPDAIDNQWGTPFNEGDIDDVAFISALIDTVNEAYTIDESRVYSCGMSLGGFMSYILACDLYDRIAAIASVTGAFIDVIADGCSPPKPLPVMQIHGTIDGTVDYEGNSFYMGAEEAVEFWREHNNCPPEPEYYALPDIYDDGGSVERFTYGPGDNDSQVVLYKVTNGGHVWPGAFLNLEGFNKDFHASPTIWKFFNQFSIDGLADMPFGLEESIFDELKWSQTANGNIDISNLPESSKAWILYDIQGKQIESQQLLGGQNQLQLSFSNLNAGTYLLELKTAQESKTLKVVFN